MNLSERPGSRLKNIIAGAAAILALGAPNEKAFAQSDMPNGPLLTIEELAKVIKGDSPSILRNGVFLNIIKNKKEYSKSELETLASLFSIVDVEFIEKYKKESLERKAVDPDKIIEGENNFFFAVWNIYREANNGFMYDFEYKQTSEDIKKTSVAIKSLQAQKPMSVENILKVDELKKELDKLQEKLAKLRAELKVEQEVERLMTNLSVENRSLSGKFAGGIIPNILKERQYSWTSEGKFPALPNPSKPIISESIDPDALLEIANLVNNYVIGKTYTESKNATIKRVSQLFHRDISEIPTDSVNYNTVRSMPNALTGEVGVANSGDNTKKRLTLTAKKLSTANDAIPIKAGSHIFYQTEKLK